MFVVLCGLCAFVFVSLRASRLFDKTKILRVMSHGHSEVVPGAHGAGFGFEPPCDGTAIETCSLGPLYPL